MDSGGLKKEEKSLEERQKESMSCLRNNIALQDLTSIRLYV